MTLLTKVVPITTNGDGEDQSTVRLGPCVLHLVRLELGTLVSINLNVTEQPIDRPILALTGYDGDGQWAPTIYGTDSNGDGQSQAVPTPVLGRIQVNVADGAADATGQLTFLYER